MFSIVAVLLVSTQATTDQQPAAPVPAATAAAPAPKKPKKICKTEDADSGSHMIKRLCLTEEEWAQRGHSMMDNSRSGFSGKAEDH